MERDGEQLRRIECRGRMTPAQSEWARCRHWIAAALKHSPGFETIEDVERLIEEGKYSFWPGANCAAICEVVQFAQKKALIVVHGGGDLGELIGEMEPALGDYGRSLACDVIMGTGREGWKRVCENHGYRFGWLVMVKDLKQ